MRQIEIHLLWNTTRWEHTAVIVLPIREEIAISNTRKRRRVRSVLSVHALRSIREINTERERIILTEDRPITTVSCVTIIDRLTPLSDRKSVISRISRNSIGFARRIRRRNVEIPLRGWKRWGGWELTFFAPRFFFLAPGASVNSDFQGVRLR